MKIEENYTEFWIVGKLISVCIWEIPVSIYLLEIACMGLSLSLLLFSLPTHSVTPLLLQLYMYCFSLNSIFFVLGMTVERCQTALIGILHRPYASALTQFGIHSFPADAHIVSATWGLLLAISCIWSGTLSLKWCFLNFQRSRGSYFYKLYLLGINEKYLKAKKKLCTVKHVFPSWNINFYQGKYRRTVCDKMHLSSCLAALAHSQRTARLLKDGREMQFCWATCFQLFKLLMIP